MERDEYKTACSVVKPYLLNYASRVLTPSPAAGKRMFVCPFCRSGEGHHGTGAFSVSKDGTFFRCFKCEQTGDITDLYRHMNPGSTLSQALKELSFLFIGRDITEDSPSAISRMAAQQATDLSTEVKTEDPMLSQWRRSKPIAEVPSAVQYAKDRGIGLDTLQRLGVTADLDFIYFCNQGSDFVHARGYSPNKGKFKRHIGSPEPFNTDAVRQLDRPVFVVEGQFDVLSLEEVGCRAIALCSTSNADKFVDFVGHLRAKPCFILMLDNEQKARETERRMVMQLRSMGVTVISLDRDTGYGEFNDVNDWLLACRSEVEWLALLSNEDVKKQQESDRSGLSFDTASSQGSAGGLIKGVDTIEKITYPVLIDADKMPPPEPRPVSELRDFQAKRFKSHAAQIAYDSWMPASFAENESLIDVLIGQTAETISTGFESLDRVMKGNGLSNGLYMFGAPPGTGKSALCLQIADSIASRGHKVLFYSLEMTAAELKTRTIARLSKELSLYRDPLTGHPFERPMSLFDVEQMYAKGEQYDHRELMKRYRPIKENLYGEYFETRKPTAEVIEAQIAKFVELFEDTKPVVFIDYLQLIRLENVKLDGDMLQRLNDISALLKRISNQCPIIVISSVNRVSYKDANLGAFKGSGDLEFSANFAAILTNKEEEDANGAKVVLSVVKSRAGRNNVDIHLSFDGEHLWFKDTGKITRRGEEVPIESKGDSMNTTVSVKQRIDEEAKAIFG